MALGNTPRKATHFQVEACKSYAFGIQFNESDTAPFDLTGCEVRLTMAEPAHLGGSQVMAKLADITDDPSLGFCKFELQAADLDLTADTYIYDVTLKSAEQYTTPILKGEFEVGANTDYDTNNIYSGTPGLRQDITVSVNAYDVVIVNIDRVVIGGYEFADPPNLRSAG